MNRASVGIAFITVVFLGNAISEDFSRGDNPAQYQGASQVLLAESGDNPWAAPDPRQRRGRLPSYITNPKYATKEDIETKLNHGNKQPGNSSRPAQQQPQPGYGAQLGLPAAPQIYSPYSGAPYGYQPGYPAYPGAGMMPGMGTPYMGSPGFGGNPLVTPYGNIYGNTAPYQETQPSSDD